MMTLFVFLNAVAQLASAVSWGAQCPTPKDTADSYFLVGRTKQVECGRRDGLDTLMWALGLYPTIGNRIVTVTHMKDDGTPFTVEEVKEQYGVEFTRFMKRPGGKFLCRGDARNDVYAISSRIDAYPGITEEAPKYQLKLGFDEFGVLGIGSKRSGMSLHGITHFTPLLPEFVLKLKLRPASAPTRSAAWDPRRLQKDVDFAREALRCTTSVVDSFVQANAAALRKDRAALDSAFMEAVAGTFPADSIARSRLGMERGAVGEMLAERVLKETHRQLSLSGKCQVGTNDKGTSCAGTLYTHGHLVRGGMESRSMTVLVSRGADIGSLEAGIDLSGKVTLGEFRPLLRWRLDSATRTVLIDTGTWDVHGVVKVPGLVADPEEDDGSTPPGMPLPLQGWFFWDRNASAQEIARFDPYPQLYRINALTSRYPRATDPDLPPAPEELVPLLRRRIRALLP